VACRRLVCWSSDSCAHGCSLDLRLKSGGFPWLDGMLGAKARTGSAVGGAGGSDLCSSRECDERQVTTMSHRLDGQVECSARLALDQGVRQSAWRGAGPSGSWFKAWGAASGTAPEINFVGCGALQGGMRTVGVIVGCINVDTRQTAGAGVGKGLGVGVVRGGEGDCRTPIRAILFLRCGAGGRDREGFRNVDALRAWSGTCGIAL
jgi:hypothetical protein